MSEKLMAELDGAEMVVYDAAGVVLAWFGGESTGIHVYDAAGVEVDYFQMEARVSGSYTAREAREAMNEHILGQDDDDDDDDDDEQEGTMKRPVTAHTTFGTVQRDDAGTEVSATAAELRDWANRGDCRWPCSTLATLEGITVRFDSTGDLVALEGDEQDDLAADELNAWSSEVLVRAGFPNHPAIRGA